MKHMILVSSASLFLVACGDGDGNYTPLETGMSWVYSLTDSADPDDAQFRTVTSCADDICEIRLVDPNTDAVEFYEERVTGSGLERRAGRGVAWQEVVRTPVEDGALARALDGERLVWYPADSVLMNGAVRSCFAMREESAAPALTDEKYCDGLGLVRDVGFELLAFTGLGGNERFDRPNVLSDIESEF